MMTTSEIVDHIHDLILADKQIIAKRTADTN